MNNLLRTRTLGLAALALTASMSLAAAGSQAHGRGQREGGDAQGAGAEQGVHGVCLSVGAIRWAGRPAVERCSE